MLAFPKGKDAFAEKSELGDDLAEIEAGERPGPTMAERGREGRLRTDADVSVRHPGDSVEQVGHLIEEQRLR